MNQTNRQVCEQISASCSTSDWLRGRAAFDTLAVACTCTKIGQERKLLCCPSVEFLYMVFVLHSESKITFPSVYLLQSIHKYKIWVHFLCFSKKKKTPNLTKIGRFKFIFLFFFSFFFFFFFGQQHFLFLLPRP